MNRHSQPSCPNLETRLGAVPAVTYRPQSSSEPGQRTDVGPIGRSASKKNYSSMAKIRTCQLDYGKNRYLETGNEIGDELGD